MSIYFDKVTIVGVGLIGGSFAKALKKRKLAKEIFGFGREQSHLEKAVELGVVDHISLDPKEAFSNCDLIFVAVPLTAMLSVFKLMQPFVNDRTIITDGGSSKKSVIGQAKTAFGQVFKNFVPAHPIAGKELSGVEASCDKLYENHRVVLTPEDYTSSDALEKVRQVWQLLGSDVSIMTAETHDEILAATSHLPHLLAYALVNLLIEHNEDLGDVFQYTAGGFRDFTRIASSDPYMWRDIALSNRSAILRWIENYQKELSQLSDLIKNNDGDALYNLLDKVKARRDKQIKKKTKSD